MSLRVADRDTDRWFLRPALVAVAGVIAVVVAIALNFPSRNRETVSILPSFRIHFRRRPGRPISPPLWSPEVCPASMSCALIRAATRSLPAGRSPVRWSFCEMANRCRARSSPTIAANRFVPEAPLPPGAHRLELEMRSGEGVARPSAEEILLVVPKRAAASPGTRRAPARNRSRCGSTRGRARDGIAEAGSGGVRDGARYRQHRLRRARASQRSTDATASSRVNSWSIGNRSARPSPMPAAAGELLPAGASPPSYTH